MTVSVQKVASGYQVSLLDRVRTPHKLDLNLAGKDGKPPQHYQHDQHPPEPEPHVVCKVRHPLLLSSEHFPISPAYSVPSVSAPFSLPACSAHREFGKDMLPVPQDGLDHNNCSMRVYVHSPPHHAAVVSCIDKKRSCNEYTHTFYYHSAGLHKQKVHINLQWIVASFNRPIELLNTSVGI